MSQKTLRSQFAALIGCSLTEVGITTLATPIFPGRNYAFTNARVEGSDKNVHLDADARITACLDESKEEPELMWLNGDTSAVQKGEEVLFVKPIVGNSAERWMSRKTFEVELDKLANASFVRVSKETWRGTKLIGKCHVGIFYWSYLKTLQDFQDKDEHGYHLRFVFETKKFGGEWTEIADPCGFAHPHPSASIADAA